MMSSNQKGAAAVEYMVGVSVFSMVMFTPYIDGNSVTELLINALRESYQAFIWAMSVPI